MWNCGLILLLLSLMMRELYGFSYQYDSGYSELTITSKDPVTDTFYVEFEHGSCRIQMEMKKSELSTSKSYSRSNCGFVKFLRGSLSSIDMTLIFTDLNLAQFEKTYQFILADNNGIEKESGSFFSPPSQPSQVRSISYIPLLHSTDKLRISWQISTTPRENITKYSIFLTSRSNSDCVALWTSSCGPSSECGTPNQVGPGKSSKCTTNPTYLASFSTNATQYSYDLTGSNIKPVTQYIIYIQPGNRWGWGPAASLSITSPQASIGSSQFVTLTTDYSTGVSVIRLSSVTNASGEISKYSITLRCVMVFFMLFIYFFVDAFLLLF